MRQYVTLRTYITDLKGIIIINRSKDDFITSDDPCFFTNRFYIQKIIKKTPLNFGLASSGALFFLPLTPRHQLMCYDRRVYTVPDSSEYYVATDRLRDISALNELQYLKAAENLYFSDWDDRERIATEFQMVSGHRPKAWHEISVLVQERSSEAGEYYRRATDEERQTATKTLQVMSSRHPEPLHWISKLRYRSSPKVYYNGSAAGYVRKREWLTGEQ